MAPSGEPRPLPDDLAKVFSPNRQGSLGLELSNRSSCPKPALRCGAVAAAGSLVLLDLSRDAIEINPLRT